MTNKHIHENYLVTIVAEINYVKNVDFFSNNVNIIKFCNFFYFYKLLFNHSKSFYTVTRGTLQYNNIGRQDRTFFNTKRVLTILNINMRQPFQYYNKLQTFHLKDRRIFNIVSRQKKLI